MDMCEDYPLCSDASCRIANPGACGTGVRTIAATEVAALQGASRYASCAITAATTRLHRSLPKVNAERIVMPARS